MIKLKSLLPECEDCGRDWNHGQDHEGSMAQSEIKDAISNASKIQSMMGQNDNLPGWVSSYITLASDYLHSIAEYMAGQSTEMQQPGPGFNTINESIDMKKIQRADNAVDNLMNNISTNSNIPTQDKVGILRALEELHEFIGEVGYDYEMEDNVFEAKTSADSVETQYLNKGDILGSGEEVISISRTPNDKIEITGICKGKPTKKVYGKNVKLTRLGNKKDLEESKPSAGLTKKEKSDVVKKAQAGKDIGKKGKGFEKVAQAAGGGEKGQKIAAAAMWKNIKR